MEIEIRSFIEQKRIFRSLGEDLGYPGATPATELYPGKRLSALAGRSVGHGAPFILTKN